MGRTHTIADLKKYLDNFIVDLDIETWNPIGDMLLTQVPVTVPAGTYLEYPAYSKKLLDTTAAYRASSQELEPDRPPAIKKFATELHQLKSFVSDAEVEQVSDVIPLYEDAAREINEALRLSHEKTVADMVYANLTGANSADVSVKWDAASAKIEQDIRDGIQSFKNRALIKPNTIVIPDKVWQSFITDKTLRDMWLYIPNRPNQDFDISDVFKKLFLEFDRIFIPEASYDTTGRKKTPSMEDMWPNQVALMYIAPSPGTGRTYTWASQFNYKPRASRVWESIDPDGNFVRLSYENVIQEVCPTARFIIKDVLTEETT